MYGDFDLFSFKIFDILNWVNKQNGSTTLTTTIANVMIPIMQM